MELRLEIPISDREQFARGEDSLPEGFRLEDRGPVPTLGPSGAEMILLALSFPVSVTASVAATLICNYLERTLARSVRVEGIPINPEQLEESILRLAAHIEKKRKRLNISGPKDGGAR